MKNMLARIERIEKKVFEPEALKIEVYIEGQGELPPDWGKDENTAYIYVKKD
jgi:hypothetical protein